MADSADADVPMSREDDLLNDGSDEDNVQSRDSSALQSLMPFMKGISRSLAKLTANMEPPLKRRRTDDDDSAEESDNEHDEVAKLMADSTPSNPKSDGEDAHWFEGYEDDLAEEQTGPKVSDKLLPLLEKRFRKTLTQEKVKSLQDKHLRPSNCPVMEVPRVNPEIWSQVAKDRGVKTRDLHLANVQRAIGGASTAMLRVMERLLTAKKPESGASSTLDAMAAFTEALDGIALLGHASHLLSLKRRGKTCCPCSVAITPIFVRIRSCRSQNCYLVMI